MKSSFSSFPITVNALGLFKEEANLAKNRFSLKPIEIDRLSSFSISYASSISNSAGVLPWSCLVPERSKYASSKAIVSTIGVRRVILEYINFDIFRYSPILGCTIIALGQSFFAI